MVARGRCGVKNDFFLKTEEIRAVGLLMEMIQEGGKNQ
jgi:hypothetical protein